MRLTTFTDYTIRVLIYMGLHPDQLTTVGELARRYDVSRNHLTKVIHYLGQKGLIETTRGKGGGIRLATAPQQISIGKLVRDTERNSALVECFNQEASHCKIEPACRLRGILVEAQEAFYQTLDRYTIADLLKHTSKLNSLLAINL